MRKDREASKRVSTLGYAAAVVAAAGAGFGLFQWGADSDKTPAAEGIVIAGPPDGVASSPPPASAAISSPAESLPKLPDEVVTHVRQSYPLLTEVDFNCDAGGCALTGTIPPPTGDAFLKQRQEMLLGGLAKLVAADGYRMLGPVQMEEVDDNVFHIRASVAQARGQAM